MIQKLTGKWLMRRAESADPLTEVAAADHWTEATVPGCVHLDLIDAEVIPDPFYGFNDQTVAWVADANWLYRREFDCPAEILDKNRTELVFEGLDTFATVHLNGQELGRPDNMFRRWRYDVTGLLKPEGNELLVLFESARTRGDALREADEIELTTWFGGSRIYVRKAQYASGWDWGPDLNTMGVWQPVYLEAHDKGRLLDVCARTEWDEPDRPMLHVDVELEAYESGEVALAVAVTGDDTRLTAQTTEDVAEGRSQLSVSLRIEEPHLWWPAGMGPQALYTVNVTADLGGEELSRSLRTGLRRVELVREEDEEGESFVFHVNGEPVFCRGANWVPADSFLPRVGAEDYEALLGRAAEANMNMIRVWGGGIYEDDEFYELCDRLGLMVWQDFMLACATYPEHLDEWRENVRQEAEQVVRRLRNHPCVVLWCGNNECQMLAGRLDAPPHEQVCEQMLPELCARLDPTRPYWPGSPYGEEDANSPGEGDQHNWSAWWGWQSPEAQRDYSGRFISEYGLQAPPSLETVRRYIPSSGHHVQSRVMEHHNRAGQGTERLYRHLSAMFRVPAEFEDTVYLMQLTQGEAVKLGAEHWRSRKFRTAGALVWQLSDCWPAVSWAALDYMHRPKALHYYTRRFFSPVLPAIDLRDDQFAVRIVNDRPSDFHGQLICGFSWINGDPVWGEREEVDVTANSVLTACRKPIEELRVLDPTQQYFWVRLMEDGAEVARNAWFLVPYKHVRFQPPDWEIEIESESPREHVVELTAAGSFAKGVWLRLEGVEAGFSDNYFDAFPEVPVQVRVSTQADLQPDGLHRRLRVRSVADVR
ncbi:MAG: glycoside hydrolase family 2 protein [Candidatus Brocadiia bacterium]